MLFLNITILDKMANKRVLKITLTETEEGTSTILNIKGLTDFEVVGMLSYYLDSFKVKMMRSNIIEDSKDEKSIS
jgi:hypothetical protein